LSTESWIALGVAVAAIVVLGLGALVEASLATVNRLTLRELIEGRIGSQRVPALIDRPQMIRSAMLLLELLCAVLAAIALTRLYYQEVPHYGVLLGFITTAIGVVFAGRVIPTLVSNQDSVSEPHPWRRLSTFLAWCILPFTLVADGLVRVASPFLRRSKAEDDVLLDTADTGAGEEVDHDDLGIEEDEQEMISGILHLEEAMARDIMVNRLDVVAVPIDEPIMEVVEIARRVGHSRIPAYRDSIDTIVGVIYVKDLLRFVGSETDGVETNELLRPAYFVPESKRVDELLHDMQDEKIHIAIVVDEYGGTSGLVTIEDILEEIVGEIQDEYDRETPLVEWVGSEEVIVDGRIGLDEVADIFETDFAPGEHGTIGGFVQRRLGRIPVPGEVVQEDGLLVEVTAVEHHRVRKLRVYRNEVEQLDQEDHRAGAA